MSAIQYCYVIQGQPITKKNSQRIARRGNRAFILPSARYADYEAAASYYLRDKPPAPIDCPVTVTCLYFMQTRRKVDLTNLLEATHDVLVKHGILADDNSQIIVSVDGSRVCYDKENPRTEITITKEECPE